MTETYNQTIYGLEKGYSRNQILDQIAWSIASTEEIDSLCLWSGKEELPDLYHRAEAIYKQIEDEWRNNL